MTERDGTTTGGVERRDLLKLGAAAAAGLVAGRLSADPAADAATKPAATAPSGHPWNPKTADAMPTRNLGRTGFRVGIFSLGGQAAIEKAENDAVAVPLIERALDLGVNYVDTSARYGGEARWSERYFGQVLPRRRKEVFVATKTHDRGRDGSLKLLETSLKLLRTDHVDLWQLHAMSTMEDVEKVTAKGGALEAFREAREQKLVRFLGLTGHTDPAVLAEAIRRFPFDTVLLAVNAADPHHLPFASELLPLAVEREMGIVGMKIPARGRLLAGYVPPPLEEQRGRVKATRTGTLSMAEAMRYVLTLPVSTVIVGCDSIPQLEENVAIAKAFTPLSGAQLASLEVKAAPVAQQSLWFRRA
ncbi:MAG: aldo/keto reductase [Thermoanaerobaculia bacterium]|nr:aldo/keto reductase [Thermoanaerobaculia bacterium]